MTEMIAIARPGTLDEGDVARFLTVGWSQQFATGRSEGVHHAFELNASDHIAVAAIAVGLDALSRVWLPASGEDYGTDVELDHLFDHI